MALLAAGCGVQPPVPEDRYYRLAPDRGPSAPAGAVLLPGVLVVERPVAEGVFGERAILYSDDPAGRVLKQYHYHYWLKAPPRLVQDFLVRELRHLGVAARVLDQDTSPSAEFYRLSSRLLRFERLRYPDSSVVEMEFALTPPGAFEPRFVGRYSESHPTADQELTTVVAGFEMALGAVVQRLRADLAGDSGVGGLR